MKISKFNARVKLFNAKWISKAAKNSKPPTARGEHRNFFANRFKTIQNLKNAQIAKSWSSSRYAVNAMFENEFFKSS